MENSSGLTLAAKIIKARSQKEKVRKTSQPVWKKEKKKKKGKLLFMPLLRNWQHFRNNAVEQNEVWKVQQWRDNECEDDSLLIYL